jgi:Na+-translocating ferredoxin:NAD+ oxidoreductase RnfG subunit
VKASQLKKLYPVWLFTLVVFITLSLLVNLESITRVEIAARQDQETLELLQTIFPEANLYTFDEDTEIYTIYNKGRSEVGYAFYGSDRGYRGEIIVLVGLEDKETIRGITVTQQHEDYWYWYRLIDGNFFEQFAGLKIVNCFLKGYGAGRGQVDAASGATISSWGVVDAVRKSALEKIETMF